jgi:hypothetical protein
LGGPLVEARGEGRGLSAAFHAKLRLQVRDVVLYRLLGQDHALGDLAICSTFSDELEDPAFLWRQAGQSTPTAST